MLSVYTFCKLIVSTVFRLAKFIMFGGMVDTRSLPRSSIQNGIANARKAFFASRSIGTYVSRYIIEPTHWEVYTKMYVSFSHTSLDVKKLDIKIIL